jgi:hypothetical protein
VQDEEAALEGFSMAVSSMSIDARQAILKKLIEGMSQTWAQQVCFVKTLFKCNNLLCGS